MRWPFLQLDWSRPLTRKVAAVLAYLGVVGVEAGLANIPVTVDVAKFSPVISPAGHELVIRGPLTNSTEGVLFSKTGDTNQILDVYFPRARLAPSTVQQMRSLGAPSDVRSIKYVTQEAASPGSKQHCHPGIEIALANAGAEPEVELYQLDEQADSPYVEMEVKNAALAVTLNTDTDSTDQGLTSCGYQKLLRLSNLSSDNQGDRPWDLNITQPMPPITVIVDSEAAFRFYFRPLEKTGSSQSSGTAMLALNLGAPKIHFEDTQPFRAQAVLTKPQASGEKKTASADFSAHALSSQALLDLSKLEIGADRVQLSLSGKARVEVQGKEQTANLWDKIKEVPLLQRSFETANTALLGWVGFILFRRPKEKA